MINSRRYFFDGELLFIPHPHQTKTPGRVVIQAIDAFDKHSVIDADEPSAKESPRARSGNHKLEMRHDKCLSGETEGPSVW